MKASGKALHTCDVLVVGAGPAGMAAALAAAAGGAEVVLVDDNPALGGQIWRQGPGAHLPPQAVALQAAVEREKRIRRLPATRVVAWASVPDRRHALLLENAEHGWVQACERLVLCTGGRELLLPFPGWTLPGVTGAGGLQALIKAGLPVAGQRLVVAGSGPLLLAAADTARCAGAEVVLVAEQASWSALCGFALQLPRWPGKTWQALQLAERHYRAGTIVTRAHGRDRVEGVKVRDAVGRERMLRCDRLACGFGLVPNTQLGQMLGCGLGERRGLAVDALMRTSVPGILAAGECTGFGGSERALVQGEMAGHVAAGALASAQALARRLARWQGFADVLHRTFALQPAARTLAEPDTLVCRCEDVSHARLAERSGWIDAKLHTRCGMGPCQGRVCGAAAQELYGWQPPVPRHLLAPARVATLAGTEPPCAP